MRLARVISRRRVRSVLSVVSSRLSHTKHRRPAGADRSLETLETLKTGCRAGASLTGLDPRRPRRVYRPNDAVPLVSRETSRALTISRIFRKSRDAPANGCAPLGLERDCRKTALRKGDSPILLRRLRKIGRVPGRFATVPLEPSDEAGCLGSRPCEDSALSEEPASARKSGLARSAGE